MGSWSISICRYLFGRLNWPLIPFPKFCGHAFYCNISIKQWEIGEIVINLRWFRWRYLKSWPSCLSIHPMNGEVVEIPATSCGKPTWCNSDALLWKKWAEPRGVEFELAHWVVAIQIRYRSMVTVRLIRIQPPSSPLFEASLGGCSGLSLRFAHASVGPWTFYYIVDILG